MSPAERWLRERLPGAPPRLLEAMVAEVAAPSSDSGDATAEPVADVLAAAAMRVYARLLERGGGKDRGDALPLLAADALLTHALEARAEEDPTGLAEFAGRWGGAGRLGELAERLPASA